MDATAEDLALHLDQARLVLGRLAALLDRAQADGGNVIAIAAVRRVLAGQPNPPPDVHILEFAGNGPAWLLRHPPSCPGPDCVVAVAARKTLTLARYDAGVFEAWAGQGGWLCTQARQP